MKNIFPIKTMLGPEGFRKTTDDYTQLKNPLTECLGLHLGMGWEGVNGVVKVHIWDDNGGGFVVCIGEHKGAVYAWLEDVATEGSFPEEEPES